jgi:GNAT superfamily N-acetyltransferase
MEREQPTGIVPRRVRLKDGVYLLRALHAGDESALIGFFHSHTEETVYLRYGYTLRDMGLERARSLVGVDQSRDPALGIFETPKDGGEILHAVGRYYLGPKGDGEVAFVTRESKRRTGMGSMLLGTLTCIARSRNLSHLWGQVLHDNLPMLELFEKAGFRKVGTEGGSVIVRLDLRPPKPGTKP